MMQKSMITYMTLAAPLLPGADAVQCARWFCCGAKTSPEDPIRIPTKLAVWDKDALKINAGNNTPKRFCAEVVQKNAKDPGYTGWPFPKYNIAFWDADDADQQVIKKLSAKKLRALFEKCGFKDEFPAKTCCWPAATATRRVAFLKRWLSGKEFYDVEDEESIRRFSAIPTKKFTVPMGAERGHPTYEIQFSKGQTSKTASLNSTQIENMFPGCKMPDLKKCDSHAARIRPLSEWLEGKQFYVVVDKDAEEFDFLPKPLSSETAEQWKETPEHPVSPPNTIQTHNGGKKTSKQSPPKRRLCRGHRTGSTEANRSS